jgi:hypothetical protein
MTDEKLIEKWAPLVVDIDEEKQVQCATMLNDMETYIVANFPEADQRRMKITHIPIIRRIYGECMEQGKTLVEVDEDIPYTAYRPEINIDGEDCRKIDIEEEIMDLFAYEFIGLFMKDDMVYYKGMLYEPIETRAVNVRVKQGETNE